MSSANISSFLSTTSNMSQVALKSILAMPTKLLSHLRRTDSSLVTDLPQQQQQLVTASTRQSTSYMTNIPGPWAFVTSGYAIALVLMALLLNRIQHIVVPPRQSLLRRLARHYSRTRQRQSIFRFLISLLLPINLSSTTTRAIFRLPSIYMLWRSLFLLTVILLQTCNLFPSFPWLKHVGDWASQVNMKEACWTTFLSVCIALAIEALMRGLEGRVHSSSPFNLFAYAFLLHIYSSPAMHVVKPLDTQHTRPDKHVLITIIIPLLQLTLIQTISIRQKWANQRLIPTTICGLLNLLHFHYVVFFSSTHYPLVNYVSSVLETALFIIILLTLSLHILTQVLLEGRVTRPFFGPSPALLPHWDEDFSVALLRLGTASLDATSAAGLGNELAGINVNAAEVELDRNGVFDVRQGNAQGFQNEIKNVKVPLHHESDSWIDTAWIREWERFLWGVWSCVKALYRFCIVLLRKKLRREALDAPVSEPTAPPSVPISNQMQTETDTDIYARFLRGEDISDDDGEYIEHDENPTSSRSSSVDPSEDRHDSRNEETTLYSAMSDSSIAPLLLAHVGNKSSSPLTRRRYKQLASIFNDDYSKISEERRRTKLAASVIREDDEGRRNCVVCTVEPREVICWPCRCLALCDECRANLASRLPASKHSCPCCRRNFLHEISDKPSPIRSESYDQGDSYEERGLRGNHILQSRFSAYDDSSSSEDENIALGELDFDDEENYSSTSSPEVLVRNRGHSTSPSRLTGENNITERDSHIRDSIVTIKVQTTDTFQNHGRMSDDTNNAPQTIKKNGKPRVPQLSLSIPHQFGSVRASHKLVIQDLRDTLRRQYGSPTSPTSTIDPDERNETTNESMNDTTTRARSGTIKPLDHKQFVVHSHRTNHSMSTEFHENTDNAHDHVDTPPSDLQLPLTRNNVDSFEDFHNDTPNNVDKRSLDSERPVSHTAMESFVGIPLESKESAENAPNNVDTGVANATEVKPKTPQTPSWFKPLKLATMFGSQSNTMESSQSNAMNSQYNAMDSPLSTVNFQTSPRNSRPSPRSSQPSPRNSQTSRIHSQTSSINSQPSPVNSQPSPMDSQSNTVRNRHASIIESPNQQLSARSRSGSLSPTSLLAWYSENIEDPSADDVRYSPLLTLGLDKTIESTPQETAAIPVNSPQTVVLSDAEDSSNSVTTPSHVSTLDIDMALFPSAHSEYDDDGMSSAGSVTLSVLMGASPRVRQSLSPAISSSESVVDSYGSRRVSPGLGEFHNTLSRRARKIKESVSLLGLKGDYLNFEDGKGLESLEVVGPSHRGQMSTESTTTKVESPIVSPPYLKSIAGSPRMRRSPDPFPRKELQQGVSSFNCPPNSASTHSSRSPDPSYRPQLLFAIASDKPEMVEDLLASGISSVNEMADSGTDLLEFTVSNENLKNRTQIVKTLLKYGADPAILSAQETHSPIDSDFKPGTSSSGAIAKKHTMNAAMEYFLTRESLDLDSKPTLQALEQSSFAPLAKARFDIIGQDRVLDEFYRVVGVHSQRKSRNALVILLCGASGHGKSFLAQKVGSLLNVPIHTINMTALRSQYDLWQCLSTGVEDASPNLDLGEFLVENQGRRCVVVLDEIEKVDDPKALNPLLLPWDIGRCSLEQKKHTDTSQVIWIATSNLGQRIIAEHVQQWKRPDVPPNRNEYIQLGTAIRRSISDVLGAPLLSRITAILPFLPFTLKEKRAIGTEAVLSYPMLMNRPLSSEEMDAIVDRSVGDSNLVEEEGARSLYRIVETHMVNFNESNDHA